jgi:hypothetical protein
VEQGREGNESEKKKQDKEKVRDSSTRRNYEGFGGGREEMAQ